jgi:hypothetical protein
MVPLICCQLGAREHYAIPRALFRRGTLTSLLTDAWFPPSSLVAKICGHNSKLAERFHDELSNAPVKEFSSSLILFETLSRVRRLSEWQKIIARNRWFQRKVVSFLRSQPSTLNSVKERGRVNPEVAITCPSASTQRGSHGVLRSTRW